MLAYVKRYCLISDKCLGGIAEVPETSLYPSPRNLTK